MKIIKRNGTEVQFDKSKIIAAITKANNEVLETKRMPESIIESIAEQIETYCSHINRALNVEEIQNLVENNIMNQNAYEVARHYITYRYTRALARKANSTDEEILSLIECNNEEIKQENSNKNPTINSVQRDYMAGEVSKDLTRRILLPKHIVDAHDAGIIHFHDADYFSQHMHNCFHSSTEFVTNYGVLKFKDCVDGQIVQVKDMNGYWRYATVHKYGKQRMQKVLLKSGNTFKEIKCTENHRWVLRDGNVTTNLQVGNKLWLTADSRDFYINNSNAFCLGFILGDGTDYSSKDYNSCGVKVRLCGEKIKYIDIFTAAGFKKSTEDFGNGDVLMVKRGRAFKQEFIKSHSWNFMSKEDLIDLFNGYYAADGAKNANKLCTSNPDLAQMIREISAVAGYYISSENCEVRNTNYKNNSILYSFHFMISQKPQRVWTVADINKRDNRLYDAWCVEEPLTHTFTLDSGIVTGNCDLVNLEDMLQNGTVISETMIEKPHSFSTACNIATQIIAQVASSQYGGQSITLSHLAPFVDISRQKIRKQVESEYKTIMNHQGIYDNKDEEIITKITEDRVKEEINKGVQTIQYQITTLMTTNGQAPFVTVFMYLNEVQDEKLKADLALIIEEMLKQRMQGVKNEKGVYVTPAFPKLIYVLEEDNIYEDSKYYYLTELAAKCTAKRLVPDYISEKIMKQLKVDKNGEGHCYTAMGCRSFLTPYIDPETGKPKYYGRFNQGVVTINLVDIACSSKGDINEFWKIMDDRLKLCKEALMCRHNRLKGTPSDVAPVLWQYGALARLKKGETIDKLLYGGYSTISLGYAGLYECVKYMTGKPHTDPDATPFAIEVMQHLNDACSKWKSEENIDFSLYGTPLESTTYKFAKCLQKRFGIIPGVTDKNYITNSYHVHVTEEINAFDKLTFESQFQPLSPGGAISYVEVPNMQDNIEAVLAVMKHIYDHIMYAELNTKSDYCMECGYDGEIQIVKDEDGKLIWKCPNCGNTDQDKMSVARRTCGYVGTQFWNQGE